MICLHISRQLPAADETEETSETIPEDTLVNTDSSVSSSRSTIPISTNIPSNSSTISSWSNSTTQQINGSHVSETRQSNTLRNQRETQRTGASNSTSSRNNIGRDVSSFPAVQNVPSRSQNENRDTDDIDAFEDEEDDFAEGLDYTVLDEIEKETLKSDVSKVFFIFGLQFFIL